MDSLMVFFAINTLFLYHIVDKKVALFVSYAFLGGVTQGRL